MLLAYLRKKMSIGGEACREALQDPLLHSPHSSQGGVQPVQCRVGGTASGLQLGVAVPPEALLQNAAP